MKLDLLKKQWLDIVFEGRNKSYGAYDLRMKDGNTNMKAFIIGAVIFSVAVATPKIAEFISSATADDSATMDTKIRTVKLPPKEEKPKENLPPPPPPPPKVDQVKFVKPVVAKTEEVTEEPPKMEEIKDKNLGKEDIKGDPNAVLTVEPPGNGPAQQEVVEDNTIYSSAGIEVKPDFPGGIAKFYSFIQKNYVAPDEPGLKGQVFVSFVVEKDGSLTDIKILRDIGYGTGKEAERVLRKCPRWTPAEQNGKKVRCSYQIPIKIETPEE
ncbi:energy transducer TonB [Flavobacterium stagni]|uniref:Energy transducer TonB n=1 Tax=Flavobacterium stagni TaxID=2506421 RepID=A0A4Q1K8Y5_9FLAO|nr:energy transducer TonB [Flavobacterium stagni]RXR22191.1 energy transducer TonB [Flavobacterium stagni]